MSVVRNIVIIGSGPAGYTAALYAKRAGLEPLMLTGLEVGGQLMLTTSVDNFPGFKSINGPDLMMQMEDQIKELGVEILYEHVTSVNLDQKPFSIKTDSNTYLAKAVIIATGASAKWLNLPSEEEFKGFGVSSCATCDGFFFKDQTVAVVGGGNTAVEEAIYLSGMVKKVYLIHRREELRADDILQKHLFTLDNVQAIWNSNVQEILGSYDDPKKVTGLMLKNANNNEKSQLSLNGVFIAIGHTPNTSFLKGQIDMDAEGYIYNHDNSTTTLDNNQIKPGVFSAGDVSDKIYRQAITSAGSGCKAALDAQVFLRSYKD